MESELKQILKLEGVDKVKALAGYVGDVNKALGDRERAEKQLVKALKDTATAEQLVHGEYKKEMDIVANLRNVRSQAMASLQSDNAKMMKSYFETGEELRRFYKEQRLGDRVMGDAGRAVQSFTSIIGGTEISNAFTSITNNFQTLEFSLQSTSIAAQGAGGKWASFGQTLSGLALPITAVGAGIMFIIDHFNKLNEAIDKAREKLNKVFTDTAAEYFRLSTEMQVQMLQAERSKLEAEGRKIQGVLINAREATASNVAEKMAYLEIEKQAQAELLAKNAEIRQLDARIMALQDKVKEEQKKRQEDAAKKGLGGPGTPAPAFEGAELMTAEEWFWKFHEYTPTAGFLKSSASPLTLAELMAPDQGLRSMTARGSGANVSFMPTPQFLPSVPLKPSSWSSSEDPKVKFEEMSGEAQAFYSGMNAMTNQLANTITTQVGGAFRRVFGESQSMAADLIVTFVSAFVSKGASKLIDKIPGMASGGVLTEPYIARGVQSGNLLALGESGPELVTPMNRITGMSHSSGGADTARMAASIDRLTRAIGSGVWRAKGPDLIYALNNAQKTDRATRA